MSTTPPCVGLHRIFDSVDTADHRRAKELCDACPIIDACRTRLAETQAEATKPYGLPAGTWAGQYLDPYSRRRNPNCAERWAAEDAAYDDDAAKAAHVAHVQGDRSEWALTGERVYGRRAKRAQRRAA